LRDLSERKSLELRQKEMQLELIQAAKLSSIGMLAAGIAHNLNVPLQGIINHIELLKLTRSDVPYLDDILTQSQRIGSIINNMLFKSRQEQDSSERDIDLNQLLAEELNFLNADLEFKHRVEKDYQLDPTLPVIRGIYSDFSQALLNIIKNALDAMHKAPEKKLTIKTEVTPENQVMIEVKDSGCGIPAEVRDRIFDPFFTTKPVSGSQVGDEPTGTGLGLSSAYQLMKKYHARFEVDSEINRGTSFKIHIPIAVLSRSEKEVAQDTAE
jgi:signal transduction histidine kinase